MRPAGSVLCWRILPMNSWWDQLGQPGVPRASSHPWGSSTGYSRQRKQPSLYSYHSHPLKELSTLSLLLLLGSLSGWTPLPSPSTVPARGQGASSTPPLQLTPPSQSHQDLSHLIPGSSRILSHLPLPPTSFRSPSTPAWTVALAS